jgi:hypothetical protein
MSTLTVALDLPRALDVPRAQLESRLRELIAWAQVGHFNLLHLLYRQLRIPPAVWDEVVASGRGRPGAEEVSGNSL